MASQRVIVCLIVLTCLVGMARAAAPYGYLDAADEGILAGWARDDDSSGSIQVEIYVDGNLFITGPADGFRPDVGQHAFHFRPNTFGPGSHTAHAYALGVNAAGQPDGDRVELGNSPQTWTGAAPPPVLQADGQPFFIMGWYTSAGSPSVAESEQYLSTMRRQGMNTALICYGIWLDNNSMTNRLQGAITSDMKIMVEAHRWAVLEQPGYPLSLIDDQVDLCKNYSSFLNWYLIDEPEVQGMTPAMTQARYNQIKTRDPDHTISVAHVGYSSNYSETYLAAEPPPYCDVEMTDTYPIPDAAPEFGAALWSVAVDARLQTNLALAHSKNAYINIVQTHGDFGLRIPTYIENRYLSYAPIVQGARGLLYWMHNAYTTVGHRDLVVPPIAHEIQSLVPAIISNSTAVIVSSNRDYDTAGRNINDISYLFGQDERCGYLIETNNSPNTYAVQFQLTGSVLATTLGAGQTSIPVMFEQRSVTAQPTGNPSIWTLADSVGPFGVHVYRLYELSASSSATDPPAKASKPNPDDLSISVGRTFDLSWMPGEQAASYDVYFGTTNPPPPRGNQMATIFDPGAMVADTTYYWRVDSVNAYATTPGDVWTFRAVPLNPPGKATDPTPADSGYPASLNADLSWKWGPSARSYDVYFGASNPPAFRGNQTSVSFDPGTLAPDTTYYWRIDAINDDGATAGDLWVFATLPLPGQAAGPSPGGGAVGVSLDTDVSWTAGANAVWHSVYFGPMNPPLWRTNQTTTTFDPGTLVAGTTYYWRIDEGNGSGITTGPLWTFTTIAPPGRAINPSPTHSATNVDRNADLIWTPGNGATSHNVYFGTSTPGTFRGNQTATTFDPGGLTMGTTYYWRIDEVNGGGITIGNVWSFATGVARPGDFDADGDVDLNDFGFFQVCFSGPNRPASSGCGGADSDKDTDVDLADFSAFQACFNGPNRAPAC